ncbi:MAG: ROK family protein [Nocardioidaceae bacterium]
MAGPAASEQLRRHNTALLLRRLRDGGPASRAELAKESGLAKATVGTIVGHLHALGAVDEQPALAAPRGRPGRPVALGGERLVGLGVEVNVDYMAAVALDLAGRVVLSEERPAGADGTPVTPGHLCDFVSRCHDTLRSQGRTLLGSTVAIPGLVDRDRGRVTSAPNLGWYDVDLAADVAGVVDDRCLVRVDNDANCAALAETVRGVAAGRQDIVYLTGTVGVGAGIVVDGRVLRGARGYAGEVGHMRVGDSTALCGCGRRGCWEAVVGLNALLRTVRLPRVSEDDPVSIARYVASRAGEPEVGAGLEQVAGSLSAGAVMLANALNPSMIVLGGYFEPLGRWFLPRVQEALDRDVFARDGCTAALSTLGLNAAATGAATEVLADVFHARIAL